MSTSIVKVLLTEDEHWSVESNGKRAAYASRSPAISAAIHQAFEDDAVLMIYEQEADANTGAQVVLRDFGPDTR